MEAKCAVCGVELSQRICRNPEGVGPELCPTEDRGECCSEIDARYCDPETIKFAAEASRQEASGYEVRARGRFPLKTRLEELIEFSRRMNYVKLGLAFCSGVRKEAQALSAILTSNGFEVVSVICKVGCVDKEQLGLRDEEKIIPGQHESMCNPILQADVLNEAGTDFNIMMGLCIGHDSLFLKHSRPLTTVFAVKDRVTGHNPMAALYTSGSYYSALCGEEK